LGGHTQLDPCMWYRTASVLVNYWP
jgi:hypothetical protein